MVLGAGDMGELTLQCLVDEGVVRRHVNAEHGCFHVLDLGHRVFQPLLQLLLAALSR